MPVHTPQTILLSVISMVMISLCSFVFVLDFLGGYGNGFLGHLAVF